MRMELESTNALVSVSNPGCEHDCAQGVRIWQGHTETGLKVAACIALVIVDGDDAEQEKFLDQVRDTAVDPAPTVESIPEKLELPKIEL